MSLQNPLVRRAPEGRRSPLLGWLGALILVGFLASCASAATDNPFTGGSNADVFSLMVYSQHDYYVDIYVNATGRRQLLGTVRSNQQEFFQFRYPASRPLMLELESELGEHYRIPTAVFNGGGRIDLGIARDLRNSRYIRRQPR